MPENSALAFENVTVTFGALTALDSVSARFQAGRIHVLVGQNGAGKSTLARFCTGLLKPVAGTLEINGTPIAPGDVHAARNAGLEIVHQRFSLPPTFSVADALELLAHRKRQAPVYAASGLAREWGKVLSQNGINVLLRARIRDLPVETVQALEIARALADDARVLILDEPTALLSPSGIAQLFAKLQALKAQGVTLILILHKLAEVMEIADTVSVLRSGRLVLPPSPVTELTASRLSDLMIGSSGDGGRAEVGPEIAPHGDTILQIDALSSAATETEPGLDEVGITVARGEIVGIAGVEGNGQRGLASVLCGLIGASSGHIELDHRDVTASSPAHRRLAGLRAVPFDRTSEGCCLDLPLWENLTTWHAERFAGPLGIISTKGMKAESRDLLERFNVVFDTVNQPAVSLSGGNLQRLILAREMNAGVSVMLAAQPTHGLDFQATEFVHQSLRALARQGRGILVISSDLDELFGLCDRLYVMRAGRISGTFGAPFDTKSVGDAMVGAGLQ